MHTRGYGGGGFAGRAPAGTGVGEERAPGYGGGGFGGTQRAPGFPISLHGLVIARGQSGESVLQSGCQSAAAAGSSACGRPAAESILQGFRLRSLYDENRGEP